MHISICAIRLVKGPDDKVDNSENQFYRTRKDRKEVKALRSCFCGDKRQFTQSLFEMIMEDCSIRMLVHKGKYIKPTFAIDANANNYVCV